MQALPGGAFKENLNDGIARLRAAADSGDGFAGFLFLRRRRDIEMVARWVVRNDAAAATGLLGFMPSFMVINLTMANNYLSVGSVRMS